MKDKNAPVRQNIALNKRGKFDYFIESTIEAGIVLVGSEVKSMRKGKANIAESYATHQGDEIYLINSNIAEYSHANIANHEPKRPRKLLLRRREINRLLGAIRRQGMTLVPLSLYFNAKGRAKIELGLAKGKKEHDKRATIKEREWQRDKARVISERG